MTVVMPKQKLQLTEDQFHDHDESNDGFCGNCNAVTRFGDTEPDARQYPCPDCNLNRCYGIQEALLMGRIDIVDAETD